MPEEQKPHSKVTIPSFELTPGISILIAGVIIAGAILYTNRSKSATAEAGANQQTARVDVPMPSKDDHIIGSPDAPIVLVEYSDFQCPYCEMIYPTIKQIVESSNGEVAWVMRSFPLYQIHPNAVPGAIAAECIAEQLGNDGFWKFAEEDFANQANLSTEYFQSVAKKLGANIDAYNSCLKNGTYMPKIQQEYADAQASGGTGTPYTVVINTKTKKQYPVSGAVPKAQLEAVIAQAKAGK